MYVTSSNVLEDIAQATKTTFMYVGNMFTIINERELKTNYIT